MKKMFQRMISLIAALMVVLSMTAMVCSAEYSVPENEYEVAPMQEDWCDNTCRD